MRRKGGVYFDGETYEPELDQDRLASQLARVWQMISDQQWHTLDYLTHEPDTQTGISTRLRDFRKERFGGHTILCRRVTDSGLFEYRYMARKDVEHLSGLFVEALGTFAEEGSDGQRPMTGGLTVGEVAELTGYELAAVEAIAEQLARAQVIVDTHKRRGKGRKGLVRVWKIGKKGV